MSTGGSYRLGSAFGGVHGSGAGARGLHRPAGLAHTGRRGTGATAQLDRPPVPAPPQQREQRADGSECGDERAACELHAPQCRAGRGILAAFRLVVLGGARQTGKTTLAAELLGLDRSAVFSFDNEAILARAAEDPIGLVDAVPRPAVVDEYQRAGHGFLLAVKQTADRDRRRGQLLLTGSTRYLADRSVSETLAGRAGRLVLWPLSAGERRGRHLALLRDRLGQRFTVGLVVHAGEHTLPLGERLWAVPVSALWRDD